MIESGRVAAIDDDALWVETIRRSSCGSCVAQKGCGQGLLNSLGDGRRSHLRVMLNGQSPSSFQLGQQVEFELADNVLLKAAAIVYLVPLLTMLLGMSVGHALYGSDGLAAVGAVAGFGLGFGIVRLHALLTRNNARVQPRVLPRSLPSQRVEVSVL